METLATNSLRATSWLDQWLSAIGKMVDKATHPDLMDMLISGGKSLRYVCQQESALWAEIILKRRDAALANPVPLTEEEKTKLRNSPILTSDFLFSPELSAEITEECKGRKQETFFESVVSLAKSSSSKKTTTKPMGPRKQNRRKKAVVHGAQQQQQRDPQVATTSSESRPFQGNSPKTAAKPQGVAGKSRGRGRGRGRN